MLKAAKEYAGMVHELFGVAEEIRLDTKSVKDVAWYFWGIAWTGVAVLGSPIGVPVWAIMSRILPEKKVQSE